MLLKKIGASLMCTIIMFLLCSTYSYASTNDSNIKSESEQSLTNFEKAISDERSHFNLNDNDIISNNLELGDVYQKNIIDTNNTVNGNELSKKVNKTNEYVGTIKLKDSNKPIALAYIQKENSKWVIYRLNSYNSLDNEIKDYKKNIDTNNQTVIIDEANDVYAIGSDEKGDNVKIIKSSKQLNLKKGDLTKLASLQPKLKTANSKYMNAKNEELTSGAGGSGGSVENNFNYVYLIIPISFLAYIAIFFIVSKRRSKYNKVQ